MVPVLRRLVESPRAASPSLADLALRRLYELAPEEGRPLILREIRNPRSGASLRTLGILPDRELPELDDVLATRIETNVNEIDAELLQRYASPALAPRLLGSIAGGLTEMACRPQSAVLAYFLRADAAVGQTLLDRVLTSRATTGCYKSALREVATRRMTEALEAAAVAHLDDPEPEVVISAAETLGRFGSAAALQPLRAQFERWHAAWTGRQEELRHSWVQDRPHVTQAQVESAFLQALGRGQAWLTGSPALRELRALCVTDNCRTQAGHLIDAADDTRITILRAEEPNPLVLLAQYQLPSISALEQKLTQYPKGSSFTLDVTALDPLIAPAIVTKITTFAEAHGINVAHLPRD